MGTQDLVGSHLSLHWGKNEAASWLALWGSLLESVVLIHRPHELVTAHTLNVELTWEGSLVRSKMLTALEVLPVSWETWVRTILVPLGCDVTVLFKFNSL